MIPGSNLLKKALRIIAKQKVQYYKFTGRTTNSMGKDLPSYADPVTIAGSLQPVDRALYEKFGLDLQKTYYNFYVPVQVFGIQRGISGDKLVFLGNEYQCESVNDWYGIDGWVVVLCILQK